MGLNKFADLTAEEFKALYASGYRAQEKRSKNVNLSLLHSNANPASVDWSTKGALPRAPRRPLPPPTPAPPPPRRASRPAPALAPAAPSSRAPLTRRPLHLLPGPPPPPCPLSLPPQAP